MIDPSHHRRPDPSVGVFPAVAVSIGLIVAVPVALWALANPVTVLAAAVLLGAGLASCRFPGRLVADRSASSDPAQSPSSASGRAIQTDGSGEAEA